MSTKPTTVSRLEATLCKHGFTSDGVLPLRPDANEPGHQHYDGCMTMHVGGTSVDFHERYSESKVEMVVSLTPQQLQDVAQAIADTHGSKHLIKLDAIVTVTTAVAVCETLRSGR